MPDILFLPENITVTAEANDSLLKAARGAGVDIRYGCGAGRCGLCAVRIQKLQGELSPITLKETELLTAFTLPGDGTIRFACQARVLTGTVTVDLTFQEEYSPEDF